MNYRYTFHNRLAEALLNVMIELEVIYSWVLSVEHGHIYNSVTFGTRLLPICYSLFYKSWSVSHATENYWRMQANTPTSGLYSRIRPPVTTDQNKNIRAKFPAKKGTTRAVNLGCVVYTTDLTRAVLFYTNHTNAKIQNSWGSKSKFSKNPPKPQYKLHWGLLFIGNVLWSQEYEINIIEILL
jgi:hypothetical protein